MGRTLKRVPLDFDYPLGEVWEGYLNQHYVPCEHCEAGWSLEYKFLEKCIYGYPMEKNEKLKSFVYTMLPHIQNFKITSSSHIYEFLTTKGKELNFPEKWHTCSTCDGSGIHPEAKEAHDNWEKREPPLGEGYQLWETTTEGSPKSPVFKTLDALCEWCETNATTFARDTATKEEWFKMLSDDFVYHKQGNAIFL